MISSTLSSPLYLILFFIYMLLPLNVAAENEEFSPPASSKKIIIENMDMDAFDDAEEVILESNPITNESKEPFFSFLDKPQNVISSGVEAFAKSIDEFFSDDKAFYEASGTYLRIQAVTIVNEAGVIGYDGDIKLKLRLPNTKKKLKFTLESDVNDRQNDLTLQPENTAIGSQIKNMG